LLYTETENKKLARVGSKLLFIMQLPSKHPYTRKLSSQARTQSWLKSTLSSATKARRESRLKLRSIGI